MPAKQATTSKTEADLEARIPEAIQKAFPWLPDNAVKHQIKFTFKFGRQTLEANAGRTRAEARLDVLLTLDGKNLAVMEFKRPGLELTDDDGAQGLSYARLVEPPAPLVVVTNGMDVRFIETHTGNPWQPNTESAEALKELVTNASRAAEGELRLAVDTLMRTAPDVWMQAVRLVSVDTISELTASWSEPALPFIKDFFRFFTEVRGVSPKESGADSAMMVVRPIIKEPRAPLRWERIRAVCRSGRDFG